MFLAALNASNTEDELVAAIDAALAEAMAKIRPASPFTSTPWSSPASDPLADLTAAVEAMQSDPALVTKVTEAVVTVPAYFNDSQRQATKDGQSLVTGRAAFVRGLVQKAFGTFFSSATYAKRPDVMDLYSSTDMKLAVDRISDLADAIKQGGIPMQQAVAKMLTQVGQYIRRERTFAGVSYDTQETKVDKTTAENMATWIAQEIQSLLDQHLVISAIGARVIKVKVQEVIDAANERGVSMVFSGVRHFRH